jgi:hypothetical protein
VIIRDTQSQEVDKSVGAGLMVQDVAEVTVSRALLGRNRFVGVLAIASAGEAPPKIDLTDVTIRDTNAAECGAIPDGQKNSCIIGGVNYGGGTGLGAIAGPIVSVDRFEIFGNDLCGIQVAHDGKITATDGNIHDNAIGVNIQVEGYDFTTILSPTVRVHDNDTNVDTKDLPVPDPIEALEGLDSSGR